MKKLCLALVIVSVCSAGALTASAADFALLAPPNGSEASSAPTFSWEAGDYDLFLFYSVFNYSFGYHVIPLWWLDEPLPMPEPWWDILTDNVPHLWLVIAVNSSTLATEVSEAWHFIKDPGPVGGMAEIPAGCFDMGDHFGEGNSDELPVHNVCISAFEMDVHEVTNAEYAECVAGGGCTAPFRTYSYTRPTYYGDPAYDDFPVIYVDWYQAEDYCTWAGKRLPTEAEWEYAARGGLAGKRYPWGDAIDCDDACYGRFHSSSACWDHCHNGECDNDTHPVGNYAPNGYGLYDMAGNVWEWVNDWYQSDYYSVSPPNDPPGPASGTNRVLRGGSWYSFTYFLRVASRDGLSPDFEYFNLGFRCSRDAP